MLNEGSFVEEYEGIRQEIDEVGYSLEKVIEDSNKKHFHTFIYRYVCDIEVTNITNNQKNTLNIRHDCLEFKFEYYGLNKKIKNARNKGFKFNQIIK